MTFTKERLFQNNGHFGFQLEHTPWITMKVGM